MKTEILYEDGCLLIIYKPAGLATQTARAGQPDVVSELKNYLRAAERERARGSRREAEKLREPYLGVIHRLDQPVEGLLIFAKEKGSAAALTRQLQKERGGVHKSYYAVLCGGAAEACGKFEDYLYKSRENRAVITDTPAPGSGLPEARRAVLTYRILTREPGQNLSLAEIRIETGRFHQIRAQMAHAGMPLLGDRKYGNEKAITKARELHVGNAALCACSLTFTHPASGERMNFRIRPKGEGFSFFPGYEFP